MASISYASFFYRLLIGRAQQAAGTSISGRTEEKTGMSWSRTEYLDNFAEVTKQMLEITAKKSNDYASDDDPFRNFREFGELGILVRMSDKFSRLRTALYDRKDMAVSDETVEDTILDLATYAILLLSYRRGAK